tara:strand:+ start:39 stop:353 length:315 start_codon:yes stop_codon:yes gene_type:complete
MEALEVFMTKKTRRRFSDEFKVDAVGLVTDQGYSLSEAARRLGVERSVLDRWCRKHRQQASGAPSRQEDDRDAEIKKLREEVRKLQVEKDILKKAAAFFAKESN